jgi:hypothetical protein
LVIVAIISAVAALAGVLLGQLLARNTTKQNWIRDSNQKAAVQCLAALEASRHIVDDMRRASSQEQRDLYYARWLESMKQVYPAVVEIDLMFPPTVRKALRVTTDSLNDYMISVRKQSPDWRSALDEYHDKRREFVNGMRKVLGVPRD